MSNGCAGRRRANSSSGCSRRRRPRSSPGTSSSFRPAPPLPRTRRRCRGRVQGRPQMPWSAAPDEPLCDAAAAVVAARWGMETLLTAVAEVFEELARGMEADDGELRLAPFGDTCALVSVLFSCLGIAFKFAEIEYVTKFRLSGSGMRKEHDLFVQ